SLPWRTNRVRRSPPSHVGSGHAPCPDRPWRRPGARTGGERLSPRTERAGTAGARASLVSLCRGALRRTAPPRRSQRGPLRESGQRLRPRRRGCPRHSRLPTRTPAGARRPRIARGPGRDAPARRGKREWLLRSAARRQPASLAAVPVARVAANPAGPDFRIDLRRGDPLVDDGPWLLLTAAAATLGVAVLLGWGLLREESQRVEEEASPLVVIAPDGVLLHKGNGISYPCYDARTGNWHEPPFPVDVPALVRGVEARRRFVRGDWVQIELTSGETGWVRRTQVVVDE